MSARQLIVLVIAAIAAIGALLLIRGMGARNAAPEETAAAGAGLQVLVAARDIQQGAALTPSDLAVASFPEQSISQSFVTLSAQPSAQTEYVGAIARRTFVQGEPITTNSVIQPDGHGAMAAQLEPGHRAVSIEISNTSAAGGYIQPNDRVDVIMSRTVSEGNQQGGQSEIVLQDVRVLAMGETTQPVTGSDPPAQLNANLAVLELTPQEARALTMADQMGDISLALRGVQAETVGLSAPDPVSNSSGGGVRVHAFGAVAGGGR
ncbi:MAG: Flp pilus assembly protein CpaB [Hyphomonadaceae bacterium]|nr:Flp pilus assembly protein CpaB [Hyphomonadaceae bacterium]